MSKQRDSAHRRFKFSFQLLPKESDNDNGVKSGREVAVIVGGRGAGPAFPTRKHSPCRRKEEGPVLTPSTAARGGGDRVGLRKKMHVQRLKRV